MAVDYSAVLGLHSFALPGEAKPLEIAAQWHVRLDADPAQVWLRGMLRASVR